MGFGRFLGSFLEVFGIFFGKFLEVFGRFLGGFWFEKPLENGYLKGFDGLKKPRGNIFFKRGWCLV